MAKRDRFLERSARWVRPSLNVASALMVPSGFLEEVFASLWLQGAHCSQHRRPLPFSLRRVLDYRRHAGRATPRVRHRGRPAQSRADLRQRDGAARVRARIRQVASSAPGDRRIGTRRGDAQGAGRAAGCGGAASSSPGVWIANRWRSDTAGPA